MLLMQSLTQRRAGKVANSNVRYADVKRVKPPTAGSMPQWLKNSPLSVESPSTSDLGLQAGVYGALMGLTYLNGASTPVAAYAGADVPGLLLAGSFGASLYFMTKKNVKLGKERSHVHYVINSLQFKRNFVSWVAIFILVCMLESKRELESP